MTSSSSHSASQPITASASSSSSPSASESESSSVSIQLAILAPQPSISTSDNPGDDLGIIESSSTTPSSSGFRVRPSVSNAAVITNESDEAVANVLIPVGVEGTLVTSTNQGANGFPVLDIDLFDEFGVPITTFDEPVEICFSLLETFNLENACLSFFNDQTGEFECQDDCLTVNDDGDIW